MLSKENAKRVEIWIKNWNKQFCLSTDKILSNCQNAAWSFLKKNKDEPLKRIKTPLLLILTFLDLKEVILKVSLVSKYFYFLTFNDFLWKEVCFIRYSRPDINEIIEKIYKRYKNDVINWCWKEIFMLLFNICCFECKKINNGTTRVCPILKKPLCLNCRMKDKYKLVSINDVNRFYGNYLAHTLNFSNFKFFDEESQKVYFYKYYIENCLKSIQKASKVKIKPFK